MVPLNRFRVLDITTERGFLCGKILADLGADVIKIEKPGGEPARSVGSLHEGIPEPAKSLHWLAYNANKKSITVDIDNNEGRKVFTKLVTHADCVLESFAPGYLDSLGLGYSALREYNPQLIFTSITPFGQSGPYSNYKGPDLVVTSMGGMNYLIGDEDRAPLRVSLPQGYLQASADAAVATLVAYYYREKTGRGQHVDVSAQSSVVDATPVNNISFWELQHVIIKRNGVFATGGHKGGIRVRTLWPCRNGYIAAFVGVGPLVAKTGARISAWIESEGKGDESLAGVDWENLDMAKVTQEELAEIGEKFARFFERHDKEELYEKGGEMGISMLFPVLDMEGLLKNRQLQSRGFWATVEVPGLDDDTITFPGAWAKCSEMQMSLPKRAPLVGEHNKEVYEELCQEG